METGKTPTVFENPANPYTQGLLNATPEFGTTKFQPIFQIKQKNSLKFQNGVLLLIGVHSERMSVLNKISNLRQ